MKILVSSLLLLFLSGTYSAAIQTLEQKQPPARPTVRESVKSLMYNVLALGAEVVANWESPEADRRAACEKRTEIIKGNYYNLVYGVFEYTADIFKEVHKEINATHPVYTTKVLPVFAAIAIPAYEATRALVDEIQPSLKKFQDQVKIHQIAFWEEIRPAVLKKAQPIIDATNAHLKPYIEKVRKEVANAESKEDVKSVVEPETVAESMKFSEVFQRLLAFEDEVLKSIHSDLFSAKA